MAKKKRWILLRDIICGPDDNEGIPPTGLRLPDGRKGYGDYSLGAHSSTPQFFKAATEIASGKAVIIRGG